MSGNFPSPNEVFQDRYRIVSIINRGGFGRVYRASQLELNRDVAIKVLQPVTRDGMDADEEAKRLEVVQKRFEREAQLVCQLRDSHTVVMHDYGTTDHGLLYMVLEYVDGRPLDQVIDEDGALEPERVVKITRQVLWSLQEAHALNMLHRDVKPQNIMLFDHAGRKDQVKVLDFGLAKAAESPEFRGENPDLTGEEVILGTPRYMSPEQIRGEGLEPSSDMYSLGLVMFEMLAGYKAVSGESTMNTLARHLNDQPILLPVDVHVPAGLRDIVNRMIDKDRSRRLQSAEEVLDALEFWQSATSVLGEATSDPHAVVGFIEEKRKQTVIWTVAGMMSVFLIVAILVAATREDEQVRTIDLETETLEDITPPQIAEVAPVEPKPAEIHFKEDDPVVGTVPKPRTVVVEPPVKDEPQVEEPAEPEVPALPAAAPDAGASALHNAAPEEIPPAVEPTRDEPAPEKKSTNEDKSGKKKKKKTVLDIGILK